MKAKWLRNVVGGLSFTSALFIFQACYGMDMDPMSDLLIEGKVTAKTTGLPIRNIRVIAEPAGYDLKTNEKGEFSFYSPFSEQISLTFEDIDSTQNGNFQTVDTLINVQDILDYSDRASVDIILEEK